MRNGIIDWLRLSSSLIIYRTLGYDLSNASRRIGDFVCNADRRARMSMTQIPRETETTRRFRNSVKNLSPVNHQCAKVTPNEVVLKETWIPLFKTDKRKTVNYNVDRSCRGSRLLHASVDERAQNERSGRSRKLNNNNRLVSIIRQIIGSQIMYRIIQVAPFGCACFHRSPLRLLTVHGKRRSRQERSSC